MKITPPANEKERRSLQVRLESTLQRASGGRWRVYIVPGRYGWYARALRLPNDWKGQRARKKGSKRETELEP